ncbi:MAG: hypothetical protein GY719_37180 [bacterium]|nr:hypothetical protein [bacterium]
MFPPDAGIGQTDIALLPAADQHLAAIDGEALHTVLSIGDQPVHNDRILSHTPEILCVDAAILFADILLPLEAMGAELRFVEGTGPTFPDPVRRAGDVERLLDPDVDDTLGRAS